MGLNYNRRISLNSAKYCNSCNLCYPNEHIFCSNCGQKLKSKKGNAYANIGKNGISSISIKSNKMSINSKGKITIPIAPGITYTLPNKED